MKKKEKKAQTKAGRQGSSAATGEDKNSTIRALLSLHTYMWYVPYYYTTSKTTSSYMRYM